MDKLGRYTLLYDFYGELLTDKQRQIYEAVRFGDLSLSEASELFGVSRQGIHDMVRRTEEALDEYEARLGLLEKFRGIRSLTERIRELCGTSEDLREIAALCGQIDELL